MTPAGQVELAADHQQRHRHGHDADRRGRVEDRGEAGGPQEAVREDREEEEDGDGADDRAQFGPAHAAGAAAMSSAAARPSAGGVAVVRRRSSGPPLRVLLRARRAWSLVMICGPVRTGLPPPRTSALYGRARAGPRPRSPGGRAAGRRRSRGCRPSGRPATLALRSKVSISALLPASCLALTAVAAKGAPSVTTESMDLSAWSLASMEDCTSGMLVPSTYRFCIWPLKVFLAPAQRCSWPTLPCSCRTHRAFLRPRLFSSSPTASPAIVSSWPMWRERAELLGLLGAGVHRDHRDAGLLGRGDGGLHGVGLGERDDQAVDLLVDGRVCTSWACCCASSLCEYRKLMLSLTAACLAPLWTMSQKVSPSPEWVTIANGPAGGVHRGPALAPRPPSLASSARLPPVLLHPARVRPTAPARRDAHPAPKPCHEAVPFLLLLPCRLPFGGIRCAGATRPHLSVRSGGPAGPANGPSIRAPG